MKSSIFPKLPKAVGGPVGALAAAFKSAGFQLYLVGGSVRDTVLGIIHKDLDFATDARPNQTKPILERWAGSKERVWLAGIEFGTIAAQRADVKVEVTTFRQEVYREDTRNPHVQFANDLETDLSRRDFTINAMAFELPSERLMDPFGGLEDLAHGRIRTPLSPEVSFTDDPLRMLRALRFASVFDFVIDPHALAAVKSMASRLEIVSRERVRDEFTKLMMGRAPSRALSLAVETGLADFFLPELPALKLEQDPIHRHKDVFHHTLAVLDRVIALETEGPDLIARLAAVLHDIGKPKTRRIGPDGVSFHHHEAVGAQMAEARMRELHFPSRTIEEVTTLIELHLRFHTYRLGWTDKAVRRYVRDAGALLPRLNSLVRADCTTRNPVKSRQLAGRMDELESRIAELAEREELSRLRPALNGHEVMEHLGIPPGPAVGEALDFLMEVRLDEGEVEKDEAFRLLDQWWGRRSSR